MNDTFAVYEEDGGRATVTFARELAHPPETVWPALTATAGLAHWFPATVDADLRPGGAIVFRFEGDATAPPAGTGEVTELEPASLLTYTWGKAILRWELEALPAGTRLHLTQLLADAAHAARDAASWHLCLDRLAAHLDGHETTAPGSDWRALHDAYVERGFPAPAGAD